MFSNHLLSRIVCLQSVKASLNCGNLCRQKAKGFLSLLCFLTPPAPHPPSPFFLEFIYIGNTTTDLGGNE